MQSDRVSSLPVRGGCLCGKVRYKLDALPLDSLYCQCRDCQIDSGKGHSCHVMFSKDSFLITGDARLHHSAADSGHSVYRGFCAHCGSSLLYASSRFPDAIFVTAGTLDDPGWFKPSMIVYVSSAQ